VGEVEDEFDTGRNLPMADAGGGILLDGSASLRDLVTQLRWKLPREAGVETLAGFLLSRLGHIPNAGEHVDFGARRFTVTQMDGKRIARVRVEMISGTDKVAPKTVKASAEARGAA